MKAHFGTWLKRVRNRAGATQLQMAAALGLDSYNAVWLLEKRSGPRMQGATLEALLDLLGLADEAQLDALWKNGELPDKAAIRARIEKKIGPLHEGGLGPNHARSDVTTQSRFTMQMEREKREKREKVLVAIEELISNLGMSMNEVAILLEKRNNERENSRRNAAKRTRGDPK